jgi:hypothetical protein
MTFHEVQSRLDVILKNAGCRQYTGHRALVDAAECWRDVCRDEVARGLSGDAPFFNFVVAEGVGVFALYGSEVQFHVVRGEEADFRRRFEQLAMTDVEGARGILASAFNRLAPDLIVNESLSRAWLLSSTGGAGARER